MPSTGLDQEETFAPYDLDAFNTGLSDVVVVTPNFTSAGFSLPDDIIIYPSQQSETAETGDRSDRQSGSEPHQKRMKRNISDKINRHSTKIKRTTEIVSEFTAEGFISTASMEHQTTTSTYEAIETVVSVKSVEFTEQIRSPTEHIDDIIQSVIKVEDSDANTSSRLESLLTPTFQKQKFRNPYPERKRGSVKSRFGPKATGARIRPMPFSSQSVGETVASVAAQSALMAQQQLLQPLPVQLPIVILEPSLFPQNSADMSTGVSIVEFLKFSIIIV